MRRFVKLPNFIFMSLIYASLIIYTVNAYLWYGKMFVTQSVLSTAYTVQIKVWTI